MSGAATSGISGGMPWWLSAPDADNAASTAPRDAAGPDPDAALAAAAVHDPDAFAVLYDRYYARVLNLLHGRTRDREAAEDLTGETFRAAWRQLAAGSPPAEFRPWLFRVALNAWLSHARRRSRWNAVAGTLAWWLPVVRPARAARGAEDAELAALARRELMRLPARYREPVLLRVDDEMDYGEIARILGLTPSGARTRVARGLHLLRRRLGMDAPPRGGTP